MLEFEWVYFKWKGGRKGVQSLSVPTLEVDAVATTSR